MAATSIRMESIRHAARLGLLAEPGIVDLTTLAERIKSISNDLRNKVISLLESQDVQIIEGRGRFTGSPFGSRRDRAVARSRSSSTWR